MITSYVEQTENGVKFDLHLRTDSVWPKVLDLIWLSRPDVSVHVQAYPTGAIVVRFVPKGTKEYRANFGDGTWTKGYQDIGDAKREIWSRAAIVQYRSFIEEKTADGWKVVCPSRAMRNGPAITEIR